MDDDRTEDALPTPLTVDWLGHATCRLEIDGRVILTDPVLGRWIGPLRRTGDLPPPTSYAGVDLVLISHPHHDHLDLPSLRQLQTSAEVVTAPGTGTLLRAAGLSNVTELPVGETASFGPVTVTAFSAVHPGERWRSDLLGTAVGYLVQGTRSVYFAGDTGLFDAMADLRGEVDLALLPIGGWGVTLGPEHMDSGEAAAACALIAPRFTMPIHYGTFAVPGTRSLLKPLWHRQRPDRFAAAVAARSPATGALVPLPGTPVSVP